MGNSQRLDTILKASIAVLLVSVLGLGGYFGLTVYQDRKAAEDATPALRLVKILRAQVKKAPNDAVLRVRLGEALAGANRIQDAIEQLNAALKIDPKHTGAYLDLGILAMNQKRYAQAEGYFKKIIELTEDGEMKAVNNRRETAFYQLGILALGEKKYEDALGYFKEALRIRNDASDTYYYVGRTYYLMDEPEPAMKNLEAAVLFDPNFAQAHYLLGEIYWEADDKVNAAKEYKLAATIKPDAPEPQKALEKFGDPEKLIDKARSLKKTDLDEALTAILIANHLLPDSAEAAALNGDIRLERGKRGDGPAALEAYRQAAKLDPKNKKYAAKVKELAAKYGKSAKKKSS